MATGNVSKGPTGGNTSRPTSTPAPTRNSTPSSTPASDTAPPRDSGPANDSTPRSTEPVDRTDLSREVDDLPDSRRAGALESALLDNFDTAEDGPKARADEPEGPLAKSNPDGPETPETPDQPRVTPMSQGDFEEALQLSQNYEELVTEFDPNSFPDSDEARRLLTERVEELAPDMTLTELRDAQGRGAAIDGLLEERYRAVPGRLDASSEDLLAGLDHARANDYLSDFRGGFGDRFRALEELEAGTPEYFAAQRDLRRDYAALQGADRGTARAFETEYNSYLRRVGGVQPDFASVERPPLDDGNHHAPGSPEYRGGGEGHTSTRPENFRELYGQSIPDPRETTRTEVFWSRDQDGIFHRFSGEPVHWSGSTAEGRLRINPNDIPNEVTRSLEGRPLLGSSVGLPQPPDLPDRPHGGAGLGRRFLNRAGGALVGAGIVGVSTANAAVQGEDVGEAAVEATIDQIPGSYSVRQLADGRPEEAALGAIEEWPLVGTAITEVARPVLRGLGEDVDPSLIQMGLAGAEADRLARVERNGQLVDWLHDIGGDTDRTLTDIQFTSLPAGGEGAEEPQVHFRVGLNGELERVTSPDQAFDSFSDPLGTNLVIGLERGEDAGRGFGEEQARVAAALARAYALDQTALLRWSGDMGMDLEQLRRFNR